MPSGRRGKKNSTKGFNMVNGVRLALADEELYAVCLKIFGGGMCSVKCEDGSTRTCVMRSKFRGRDKRNNMLSMGTWLLVGARDWEGSAHGKPAKCDLLEVYSQSEKETLIQTTERDISQLTGIAERNSNTDFDFVDEQTQRYRDMVEELESDSEDEEENGMNDVTSENNQKIDIDDI